MGQLDVDNEIERRLSIFNKLTGDKSHILGVSPAELRDVGLYGGAAGIWVNKNVTAM